MDAITSRYQVAAANGEITVAGNARQRVFVGLNSFLRRLPRAPTPRAVDLLMIAAGAYVVDRISPKSSLYRTQHGIRSFDVSFAVQDPLFWSQPTIRDKISEALSFLTDDSWSVTFELSTENGYQPVLPLPWFEATRVALFSEGLDSAAGLAAQAAFREEKIMLVTVGHYPALRRRVERQIQALQKSLARTSLCSVPFVLSLRGGAARSFRFQETTQRSRGLLFCAAGIAAAESCNVEDIDIYESGIGAINFPLMTGMFLGGRSSRGAHPTFLKKMTEIARLVTGRGMAFSLPYRDFTKGQVLEKVRELGLAVWLQHTRSCVHTSLRVPQATHCGVCPACIERRQAFASAVIDENPKQYLLDVFRDPVCGLKGEYLTLFIEENIALASNEPRVLRRLKAFMALTEMRLSEYEGVLALLQTHAKEVQRVFQDLPTNPRVENRSTQEMMPLPTAEVAP